MDYNKIGKFIATERKAQKLTQAKLAERVFVSEKTVSKWENGNGIPDTNSLPKLCEVFGVSLNELLSGCRINEAEYKDKAEKELYKLQKQNQETNKLVLSLEIAFGIISIISLFLILFFGIYVAENYDTIVLPVVVISVAFVLFIISMVFCLKIEQKIGYYICKKCGHKHVPSFGQVNWAMHIGRTRYMSCPSCKQKSWQKKIIK